MRKPVHEERIDGRTPRERLYAAMLEYRERSESFTVRNVATSCLPSVSLDTARTYMASLERAGYLMRTRTNEDWWELIDDAPGIAPRVRKDGSLVQQGRGTANMWGTLRRLFKAQPCTAWELVANASTEEHLIAFRTAKDYLRTLHEAGYLDRNLDGYWLKPEKDTGPLAPMIQRVTAVYDPNLSRVTWDGRKGVIDD